LPQEEVIAEPALLGQREIGLFELEQMLADLSLNEIDQLETRYREFLALMEREV